MKQAVSQLISDFLSAILFFVAYALSGDVLIAAGVAVAAALAQFARLKLARRAIEPMQWMSLGLVVVLGGASVLVQSPRFMMLKPSIVHLAIAAVMLRPGWMLRYLPDIARTNLPVPVIVAAGYAWAALLAAIAVANLVVALSFGVAVWAWFILVGAGGAKLAAFALQYLVFRSLIGRRLRASPAA